MIEMNTQAEVAKIPSSEIGHVENREEVRDDFI